MEQECARCKQRRPVWDYEGCFITCSSCRIRDTISHKIRISFRASNMFHRKPRHYTGDEWSGSWDNVSRLQEDVIGELE